MTPKTALQIPPDKTETKVKPKATLNAIRLPHSPRSSGSKEDVRKDHPKQTGSGRRKNSQPRVEWILS